MSQTITVGPVIPVWLLDDDEILGSVDEGSEPPFFTLLILGRSADDQKTPGEIEIKKLRVASIAAKKSFYHRSLTLIEMIPEDIAHEILTYL